MPKKLFIIIIVCLLWLAGCEQAAPEILPTVTAVLPQPTATATTPPTALPSATMRVETAVAQMPLQGEIEPSSEHFLNEIIPSIPQLILDPYIRPFPEIKHDEVAYQLKAPNENLLLELLVIRSYDAKGEPMMKQVPVNADFEALLLQDIDLYYDSELPNAHHLVRFDTLRFLEQVAEPLESSWKTIRAGVIQFLNEEGVIFEDGVEYKTENLQITPHTVDLNFDSESDWLLQVSATGHSISILVPFIVQPDGSYELIPNDFPSESTNILYQNELFLDYDLTGDGQQEVIWHTESYWGRGYFEELRIFSWNGQKLEMLDTIDLSRSAESPIPQFSVGDSNNDSLYDVEIYTEDGGNFECQIQERTIYSWPEKTLQEDHQRQNSTPACYIWESIYREPEDAVAELQLALTEFEPTNASDASLIALARIHLAMAQIALGQTSEAQATLDELYNLPTDVKFIQLVIEAYESAGKRPLQTCRNLLTNADNLLQTEIGNYLSYESADPYMVNFGGVDGESPHWATICNLRKTIDYMVNNTPLSADVSPLSFMTTQDISYEFATHVNLDEDPEMEWIGVIESQPRRHDLLIFDAVGDVWQPRIKWLSSDEVSDITVGAKDITGDGLEDIIVLVTGRDYCAESETQTDFQEFEILYTEDTSIRLVGKSIDCLQDVLVEIDDVTNANFTEKEIPFSVVSELSAWQILADFPSTDLPLSEYIHELQTAVLTQSDPDTPNKITDLLAYLPTDDSEAQPYREHLTYLLGYNYELSGDEEQAVAIYLSLIQQAPSSPWSWLAWARLEPMEG